MNSNPILFRAYDKEGQEISVDQFFNAHPNFINDKKARKQAIRILKLLVRHPDDLHYFTDSYGDSRSFSVSGNCTYIIIFKYENNYIDLMDILNFD